MILSTTTFCVVLAALQVLPHPRKGINQELLWLIPVIPIIGLACYMSDNRRRTFHILTVAAIAGWLFAPREPYVSMATNAMWISLTSLLFVVTFATFDVCLRTDARTCRKTKRDESERHETD